jgi:tetratricopeptide (TPR) repeat protein
MKRYQISRKNIQIRLIKKFFSMRKIMVFFPISLKLIFWGLTGTIIFVCFGCVSPQNTNTATGQGVADDPPIERIEKDNVAEAYRLYSAASLALAEQDFDKASGFLSRAVELDPSSAHLCVSLAGAHRKSGDMEAAFMQGRECLRLHPENSEIYAFLGDLYATDGDDDAAVDHYLKALEIGSSEAQRLRLMLANLEARRGRYREALEHLEIIRKNNPDDAMAQYFCGRIHLQLKEYRQAEACLSAALESSGNIAPVLFDLGTLYQVTGRTEEAIEVYKRLLTLNPDDMAVLECIISLYVDFGKHELAEHHINHLKKITDKGAPERQMIGLVYLKQGRYEQAVEELESVVAERPDDSKARYYLATAYEQSGDTARAISNFNLVSKDSEFYFSSRIHLALVYNDLDQQEQATTVLQQLREAGERRPELYLLLSTFLEEQENYDDAEAVVHEGLVYNPRDEELLFRLGVVFDKKGNEQACIDQMEMVLEVNPEHADALNYIGYTWGEKGIKLDEAERLIRKAHSLKPDSGYIVDSLGWVYFQQKRYREALNQLERAAVMVPDDPTVAEHLGDVYLKLNRIEKALFQYRKALELDHPDGESVRKKIENLEKRLKR